MATWTISRLGDKVKLTYVRRPSDPAERPTTCGEIELDGQRDLEAWTFDQAAVWDRVETPQGTFVRLAPGLFGTRA
jgi:hypothetical protein